MLQAVSQAPYEKAVSDSMVCSKVDLSALHTQKITTLRPANLGGHISQVYGKTEGLKKSEHNTLLQLYNRKAARNRFIDAHLGRQLTKASRSINRQVGLLIDRGGNITHVIVGDAHQIFIPDLSRHRAGVNRFRGLRLIHTHLRKENLNQDDFTDLSLLRLDTIVVVHSDMSGEPLHTEFAYLDPQAKEGKDPWKVEHRKSIFDWSDDFLVFIEDIESQFSKKDRITKIKGKDGVILVGVGTKSKDEAHSSIEELARLADTAGFQVMSKHLQMRRKIDSKLVVGKGKLQNILIEAMQVDADALVFDQELTPSQLRNIATATNLKVIDRSQLILDIFAKRAKTREGKLQVEIAQLRYRMPRLKIMPTAMSRLTGGIGGRGPGETKLEINRRRADERLTKLEKDLKKQSKVRNEQRKRRRKNRIPQVSLVGYTNAGKSTLLNTITHSNVVAEDQLFATLDPTSRRFRFPLDREIILTDTVGFIRNLPKELMKAFESTFEETTMAELIVHVVDAGDPEMDIHIQAVEATLKALGGEQIPRMMVFNKCDTIDAEERSECAVKYNGLLCSAITKENLKDVIDEIYRRLFQIQSESNSQ